MSTEELKAEVLPDDYNQYDLSFKMIVIGDAGVGKSCLTSKAAKGVFDDSYSATVGFEFLTFNVRIDGKVIKLQIWDTCGQEIYRSLISSFYRNASLAMMVYAINSKESFSHIETWLKEVKLQSNPDIKIFLIGNKADLEGERQVSSEEAKQFKDESGIHYFSEASAKNGLNAQEVFIEAAKLLYSEHLKYKQRANKGDGHGGDIPVPVKINNNKADRNQGGCCKS
jgi:small GTP-binding protein